MSGGVRGTKWMGILALGAVAVLVIAIAVIFLVHPTASLTLDHYEVYVGPGIDYVLVYVDNVGMMPGNVVNVTMDGTAYSYVYNALPPKSGGKWSMAVSGTPTSYIGIGQEGQIFIDTSAICHSCTHLVRIACSDGSYVEFSFRPWTN